MNSLQSAYAAAEPNAEPARARQEPPPVLLDDLHRAGGPAVPLHLERAIVLRQQSPAVPAVGVVSAPDALQKGEPEVAVLDERVARAALRRLAGGPLQDVQFTLLDLPGQAA